MTGWEEWEGGKEERKRQGQGAGAQTLGAENLGGTVPPSP